MSDRSASNTSAPRIVLSRPRIGENIGFVARLCANFALEDLVLVDPAKGWEEGARRTSAMCPEALAKARILPSLEEALADRGRVIGFSARQGRERATRSLVNTTPLSADDAGAALVFGSEESGLSSAETRFCTELCRVDLPGLGSLNLSHAVAIALQHLLEVDTRVGWRRHKPPSTTSVSDRRRIATKIRTLLGAAGHEEFGPHLDGALERLVERARFEKRDARIIERAISHLARRGGMSEPGGRS